MSCLAHVFEDAGALDKLERFASLNGPAFYGVVPNAEKMTLNKSGTPVEYPDKILTGDGPVTVFDPGFPLYWSVHP
jgi:dihydroorotase